MPICHDCSKQFEYNEDWDYENANIDEPIYGPKTKFDQELVDRLKTVMNPLFRFRSYYDGKDQNNRYSCELFDWDNWIMDIDRKVEVMFSRTHESSHLRFPLRVAFVRACLPPSVRDQTRHQRPTG